MFKPLLILATLFSFPAIAAEDVTAMLKKADSYRLPEGSSRVETVVELYRDGQLDKERRYTVYIKPGRRSLVLMKSAAESGQKLLMLADQFWLLMPDTQRPLRITPSQKLLGEASSGDIASMTWAEDYDGTVVGELPCPPKPAALAHGAEDGPRSCLRLDLTATRSGVTYSRIELLLERAGKLPVKADLYVQSGKRAKEAWFETGRANGQLRIMAMSLVDDIQPGRLTRVRYQRIVAREAPDEFFNPAALVRNSLAGW